jgi:hypothetical protein
MDVSAVFNKAHFPEKAERCSGQRYTPMGARLLEGDRRGVAEDTSATLLAA